MKNTKNIIIYFPSIENGGMEKNLFNLFNFLAKKKELNVILCSTFINAKIKKKISKQIKLIQYKSKNNFFLNRYLISFFSFIFFYRKLKKNFFSKNTIIFSAQNSAISIVLSKILNFKIIVRNGNHPWSALKFSDNLLPNILSFILKLLTYNFANKIICNSKKTKDFFEYFIFDKRKLSSIENSVNFNMKIKSFKKKNLIVSAGRLTKQKDFVTLLKGFKIFFENNKDYKLCILGEGKEKQKLINLVINFDIKKNVIFKNYVNEPLPIFSSSKIYVCTSLYEGLPSSLIEALSVKTPVISTDCLSGPNEILENGKYGYLFKIKDYKKLAYLMNYVVKNYSQATKKTLKGNKTLYKYQVENVASKYLNEIKNLI